LDSLWAVRRGREASRGLGAAHGMRLWYLMSRLMLVHSTLARLAG